MPLRTYTVGRSEAGQTLTDWLRQRLELSPAEARKLAQSRQVRVAGMACNDPRRRLRPGQSIDVPVPETSPRQSSPGQSLSPADYLDTLPAAPILQHVDDQIVIVNKPSGLTTMRHPEDVAEQAGGRPGARRYLPPTLADLLPVLLVRELGGKYHAVRAVHRLDKETTGLVVFARTIEAEQHLGQQLRTHTVERRYLAVVRGQARAGRIESNLVRDRGDGRRGSKPDDPEGQHAVTAVRLLEELGAFTLVECQLETGRTHQVRIHLGEAGTPLCGERLYDRPLHGRPLPETMEAARIMLHAATLGLQHPTTGKRMNWTAPMPMDMQQLLEKLRLKAREQSPPP
jgi:23S rRNA pseudouridine1911/1915/1917 synthase